MEQQKVDMFMMANGKYIPEEDIFFIRDVMLNADDSKWILLSSIGLKDPITAFLFSLFLGGWGIDRIYIGDVGLGIVKLITCGGFGIWTIIDWFLIMKATKEKNVEKLQTYLY